MGISPNGHAIGRAVGVAAVAVLSLLIASPFAIADTGVNTTADWAAHKKIDAAADKVSAVKIAALPKRIQRAGLAFPTGYSVGTILVTVASASSSATLYDGHAGIASGSGHRTIEAWPKDKSPLSLEGVQKYNVDWGAKYKSLRYLSVTGANSAARQKAYDQAATKIGKKFALAQHKDTWNDLFYCSHLVYGAWKRAGYNVDTNTLDWIVTPKELVASPRTVVLFST